MQGWRLNNKMKYEEIAANEKGWLLCESVDLWLAPWEGVMKRQTAHWLRFYDKNENLVLLPSEEAQQEAQLAQQEAQLAQEKYERLATRLRELGENPQDYL
ncbi:hypothetical protein GM3709_2972 [Geminocystis sp. NIES-3709]|nr:hypothetical protein GM3709_2972 [Geminocystis sp. NIES-3709]